MPDVKFVQLPANLVEDRRFKGKSTYHIDYNYRLRRPHIPDRYPTTGPSSHSRGGMKTARNEVGLGHFLDNLYFIILWFLEEKISSVGVLQNNFGEALIDIVRPAKCGIQNTLQNFKATLLGSQNHVKV